MPKSDGQPDKLGARYEGDVLSGKLTVDDALALQKAEQAAHAIRTQMRTGVGCVRGPEEYDPVLRYHLGMDKAYYFKKDEEKSG